MFSWNTMPVRFMHILMAYLLHSFAEVSMSSNKPVAMKVIPNVGSLVFKFINFYNDTFQELFNCMANSGTKLCFANYNYDNARFYQPDDLYVIKVNLESSSINYTGDYKFVCKLNQTFSQLRCQRYYNACTDTICEYAQMVSQSCDSSCVSLLWQNSGETLLYNSSRHSIIKCGETCPSTTTGTVVSLQPEWAHMTSLHSSIFSHSQTSTAGSNSTFSDIVPHKEEHSNSSNIPIIVGVVCGVGGALIVTLLLMFLVLKQKRSRRHPKKLTGTPKYVNDFVSGIEMSSNDQTSAKSSNNTATINKMENGKNNEAGMGSDGYYLTKEDQLSHVDLQTVSHSLTHPSDNSPFNNSMKLFPVEPDMVSKSNYDYIMVDHVNSSGDKDFHAKNNSNYSLVQKPPKIPLNHPNQKLLVQTDNKHLVPIVNSSTHVVQNNLSQVSNPNSGIFKDINSINNISFSKPQNSNIGKTDIDNYSTAQEIQPNDDYTLIEEIDNNMPVAATESTDVYARLREDAPHLPTNPYNELGYQDIRVSGSQGADQDTQRDATGYKNVSVDKFELSSEPGKTELDDESQDVYPV